MNDEPPGPPQLIDPDDIARELGGVAIPEGYVCFRGHLDVGNSGTHRIVVDDQFLRWLEVGVSDIAGRLASADGTDRRELIWIRRGAKMVKCEVGYAPDIANEGWGVDADPILDTGPGSDADIGLEGSTGMHRHPPAPRRRPPPPF